MSSILLRAAAIVAATLLAGCADLIPETTRKPLSPPGIAPVDEMGGLNTSPPNAGGSPAPATPSATPAGDPAATAPSNTAPAAPNPNAKPGIIGKTTAKVVDKQQAMKENPSLVEVQGSAQGGDPISFAASAYISVRAKASTLGFQGQLTQFKGIEGRNPTYDELTGMMKQHGITFAELPAYQMYGYDSHAGTIVILEDKADKARRYKEAGIPVE